MSVKPFRRFLTLADRRRLALAHHARLSVECRCIRAFAGSTIRYRSC